MIGRLEDKTDPFIEAVTADPRWVLEDELMVQVLGFTLYGYAFGLGGTGSGTPICPGAGRGCIRMFHQRSRSVGAFTAGEYRAFAYCFRRFKRVRGINFSEHGNSARTCAIILQIRV